MADVTRCTGWNISPENETFEISDTADTTNIIAAAGFDNWTAEVNANLSSAWFEMTVGTAYTFTFTEASGRTWVGPGRVASRSCEQQIGTKGTITYSIIANGAITSDPAAAGTMPAAATGANVAFV